MKYLKCFNQEIYINNTPSLLIFSLNVIFFYLIQYTLTNYIMHSTQSLLIFILGSFFISGSYHFFDYLLSLSCNTYSLIHNKEKKFYVLSNLIKSSLLFVYTPSAVCILYDTMYNDNWNNLTIKNMGSLYAIPDFVSLFMVKNMSRSTKIHHILVVIFYLSNLMNDYNKENIFRPLTVYAIFSTLSYSVNFTLAIRFFKKKNLKRILIPLSFYIYSSCCIINWLWNIYYIKKLIYINNHFTIYIYMLFISFIVWDDIILLKWLHFKKNKFIYNKL